MTKKITLKYDDFISPTPKAFLVTFGDQKVWLPQNLTDINERNKTLKLPLWLAIAKEIEGYEDY